MRARFLILAMLAWSTTAAADAGLGLRMFASSTTVKLGDTLQLDVVLTVNGQDAVDELELPDMGDFIVLRQGESQQASFSMINGRRAIVVEHRQTFILRANEPGTRQIGEATARLGAAVARAAPIAIRVVGAAGSPASVPGASSSSSSSSSPAIAAADDVPTPALLPGADGTIDSIPGERFGDNIPRIFAELRADRTTAWVGEQVTLVGEIFSQVPLGQYPRVPGQKPPGFVCLSLDDGVRLQASQRIIKGRSYYVYPVTRDAIFTLKAGPVVLEPLDVAVSPAGSFFSRSQDVQVRSAPLRLDIKPLPEPEPPDFHAENVGRVELRAAVRPSTVKVGEPFTITVEAVGWGNPEGFVVPRWTGDGSARLFPTTARRERRDRDGAIAGRIVEETLVQPARSGRVTIAPLTMTVFDPAEARYVVRTTPPMVVVVGEGGAATSSGARPTRQTIAAGARPLALGIETRPATSFRAAPVVGGALALLGGGVALFGRRRRRRRDSVGGQRIDRRQIRAAAAAAAHSASDVASAQRVLIDALAERCGDDVRAMDTSAWTTVLVDRGLTSTLASGVAAAVVLAEAARFAPGGARQQAVDALLARLADVEAALAAAAVDRESP